MVIYVCMCECMYVVMCEYMYVRTTRRLIRSMHTYIHTYILGLHDITVHLVYAYIHTYAHTYFGLYNTKVQLLHTYIHTYIDT